MLVLTAPNRHKPEAAPPADVIVTNPAAAKRQLSQFLTYKTVGAADADNHVPPERREAFTAAHEVWSRCLRRMMRLTSPCMLSKSVGCVWHVVLTGCMPRPLHCST